MSARRVRADGLVQSIEQVDARPAALPRRDRGPSDRVAPMETRASMIDRIWPFVRIGDGGRSIVVAVIAQLARTVAQRSRGCTACHRSRPHGHRELPQLLHDPVQRRRRRSCSSIAAIWAWTKGKDAAQEPRGIAIALACVTTYMIVTGIVYNTLLRGVELPQGVTVWWSNEILHVVAPLLLLADLFFAPEAPRARLVDGLDHRDLPDRLGGLHARPCPAHHRTCHRRALLVPVPVPRSRICRAATSAWRSMSW